ncbi:terminase small subunit-like protein [Bradyrhizobium diazoefficiens]|uniref:terminase small subunit-like protein n=1 Tax=Bradyrhizobium diazoefficiens TaxID=1355477 RepID=UPI0035158F63
MATWHKFQGGIARQAEPIKKRSRKVAPFKQTTVPAHYRGDQTFGRPSEYRPEYCRAVIDFMAQGYSLTAFAGSIRVARDTVYRWIREHTDFSDAVSRARPARVTALERKLLLARKGAETSAAVFALKNADPEEWRDVRSVDHQHNVKVETLTDAQLYAIASQKAGAHGTVIDGEYTRTADEPTQ